MLKKFFFATMVLFAVASQICNAQSLFNLHSFSSVKHNDKDYKPVDTYVFEFKKTGYGYSIECPNVCVLNLSNDLVYREKEYDTIVVYMLWDSSSIDNEGYFTKGIKYSKKKNTSKDKPCNLIFSIVNGEDSYHMMNSYILYDLPNNTSSQADQALPACSIDEDKFISFMKSFKKH